MAWQWFQSAASNMHDVAGSVRDSFLVVLAGADGSVWRMPNWNHFTKDSSPTIRRVALSPNGKHLFGVGTDGTIWHSPEPNSWTRLDSAQVGRRIEDAVVNYDGSLWVTTENGMVWSTSDSVHWTWLANFLPFKRIAVGPNNAWWSITHQGDLMWGLQDPNAPGGLSWHDTAGKGFEDITVTVTGEAWMVGSNGTIWRTRDGQSFSQQGGTNCLSVSAVGDAFLYFVLKDGTMWVLEDVPTSPTGAGSTGAGSTGAGSTGAGSTPTSVVPVLSASVGFNNAGAHVLRIGGSGFQPSETVDLMISYRAPGPGQGFEPFTSQALTADGLGRIAYEAGVICPATPELPPPPTWQAQATGRSSGRRSTAVQASC